MWLAGGVSEEDRLDAAATRRVLRRTAGLLRPYRRQSAVASVAIVGYVLTQLAGPFIVRIAIDRGVVAGRESVLWAAVANLDRVALRPEVVDLGAVGRVVVDDDQHVQPIPSDCLHLRQGHHGATIPERGHRQPVRAGNRRPDGTRQPQPDRLERLGEDKALGIGHAQVHRRIAHEVA